jgi:hypothetical protein
MEEGDKSRFRAEEPFYLPHGMTKTLASAWQLILGWRGGGGSNLLPKIIDIFILKCEFLANHVKLKDS